MKAVYIFLLTTFLSFSLQAQKDLTVYVFIAEECPISIYMTQPLKMVAEAYGQAAEFVAVFPRKNSTEESARQFLEQYDLPGFQVKLDPLQTFTKSVEATITPEVVVMEKETQEILYRGRISDAYKAPGRMKHGLRKNEIENVLAKITNKESIAQPWPHAVGCYITFHQQ